VTADAEKTVFTSRISSIDHEALIDHVSLQALNLQIRYGSTVCYRC